MSVTFVFVCLARLSHMRVLVWIIGHGALYLPPRVYRPCQVPILAAGLGEKHRRPRPRPHIG